MFLTAPALCMLANPSVYGSHARHRALTDRPPPPSAAAPPPEPHAAAAKPAGAGGATISAKSTVVPLPKAQNDKRGGCFREDLIVARVLG